MSTVAQVLRSPGRWSLDAARSTFGFRNKTMSGLLTVKGRFREFRREGKVADSGAMSGRVDIGAASLHTGIGRRDEHLRSADFFDMEEFPAISVIVTAATADKDTVDLPCRPGRWRPERTARRGFLSRPSAEPDVAVHFAGVGQHGRIGVHDLTHGSGCAFVETSEFRRGGD